MAKPAPKAKPKAVPPAKKPTVVEKDKPRKALVAKPLPTPIVEEIDEPLAKIEEKVYSPPRLKLDVPRIESSSFEMEVGVQGKKSEETLIEFLHGALHLPEFGEVKIQLTLNRDGTAARLVVLQAESKNNRAYLEEVLPRLQFPLILEQEKTFTLTFCNEL